VRALGEIAVAGLALVAACTAPNPLYQPSSDAAVAQGVVEVGAPDLPAADEAAPADADDARAAPIVGCPSDRDLVACFRFEHNLSDESPLRLPISRQAAISYDDSPQGFALRHQTDTRVLLADTTALDATRLTVEVWVAPRAFPTGTARAVLLDYQRQYSLFVRAGGAVWCSVRGVADLVAPAALTLQAWTSVACTVDAEAVTLWIDGTPRASTPVIDLETPSGGGGVGIGVNVISTDHPTPDSFDGLMDNLRVWKRTRTAAEICGAAIRCR
jgi:hypothetical protein